MNPKLKLVLALFAGAVSGSILIALNEIVAHKLYPLPAGLDPRDPAQLAQLMSRLPVGALVMVVCGWAVGAFCGALLAARICRDEARKAALMVGGLFVLATLLNLLELPHPIWMWIAGLALPLPLAHLAGKLSARPG